MKNKDLNTYISEKLEQGPGIPYKEDYWNDMNSLLDSNMPAAKPAMTGTKAAFKGAKLLYLSAICATVFAVSYTYLHIFTPSSSDTVFYKKSGSHNATSLIENKESQEKDYSPNPTVSLTTPSQQKNVPGNDGTKNETKGSFSPQENSLSNSFTTFNHQANNSSHENNSPTPKPEQVPGITNQTESDGAEITSNDGAEGSGQFNQITIGDQETPVQDFEFNLINPLNIPYNNNLNDKTPDHVSLLPYPKRNRFIKHITVSPFVGVVHESGKQAYRKAQTEYTHPVQTNYIIGVNLECTTKHIQLRSGIGLSRTELQQTTTSSKDIYTTDTAIVIVDPNYGTTVSGKPIVLVKQVIDSSVTSTERSSITQRTTYQYITIPLTLQYRIGYRRFSIMAEGGAFHHFVVKRETMPDKQLPQSEKTLQMPVYSFQLTAGAGVRYALTSKWGVGVLYNYSFNPLNADMHFLNNAHMATFTVTRSLR